MRAYWENDFHFERVSGGLKDADGRIVTDRCCVDDRETQTMAAVPDTTAPTPKWFAQIVDDIDIESAALVGDA